MRKKLHKVTRYHPLLVALHWIVAALLVAMLTAGLWLKWMPTSHPATLTVLMWHMSGGMFVLGLMLVRLFVRIRTAKPTAASSGHPMLNRLRRITHVGLYALVIGMAATGLTTAVLAGLNRIVFQQSGEPLPSDLTLYAAFTAHAIIAILLVGLATVHGAAVLWHQFVLRDQLMRRMLFHRRSNSQQRY